MVGAIGVVLALAACIGSDADDDDPDVTSTAESTTVDESADTTEPPDAAATPTTESPPTTELPPTTVSDADLAAEVEAAYLAAFDAYHAALLDPSNEALRDAVRDTHSGDGEAERIEILDDLVALNRIARSHPTLVPVATVTGSVRFENESRTQASLVACEIIPEWFFEVGSGPNGEDALLRDTVLRADVIAVLEIEDDVWTDAGGSTTSEQVGVATCDE